MQSWPELALWVDAESIDAILGPILILSIIGALVWFGYRRWRLSYGARRWTLTEAIIQSEYPCNPTNPGMASVLAGGAARVVVSNMWNAVLQYSYHVAGESYPGYLMMGSFNSREDASAAARPWLLKKISVRYNPARPYESAFLSADGAPPELRSLGDQPPASSDVISLSLK